MRQPIASLEPEVRQGACKLCLAGGCIPAGRNKQHEFVACPSCGLVFVPARSWISQVEERARYAYHDNRADNVGYVTFLDEVAQVAARVAPPPASVLDFGAGEHAVLAELLRRRGYDCVAYDPLYGLGSGALDGTYDLIVMCEVIEHLRALRDEILRLGQCLAPGGSMVVRTRCYPSVAEIPAWWYARDLTHINFFSPKSLGYAAAMVRLSHQATEQPDIGVWRGTGR